VGLAQHLFGPRHEHGHGDGHRPGHGVITEAAAYDRFTRLALLGRRRQVYAALAALSGAAPGDRVLDVGSGTGALTTALAARVGPEGQVTGVDPSEPMVAFARRSAPPHIRYAVHPAESLPFADGVFDAVASALVLHHVDADRRGEALAEMARVLRPGGRLLLVDFRPPDNRLGRALVGALTGPDMAHNDVAGLSGLIRAAGLTSVQEGRRSVVFAYVLAGKPLEAA
jgi:SAM-dependent methyltransferase